MLKQNLMFNFFEGSEKIINEIDKNAFLIITNAREVYGKGLKVYGK